MEENRLYDTSAVIELIAHRNTQLIPGYVSILTTIEYPPVIMHVAKILYPSKQDYKLAIVWQTKLRKIGTPLPAIDLVIAAQAYNNELELVTLDKHFRIIKEKLAPDLKLTENI
ncbi:type II toxin-antitoxin system VapC family toxin [Desulfurococcaceae archaeon MEX13E-LK6-19]|nr:type II toxin-antitoxin system VapC family toxin [Desulfurococcaceae archaeon MEX13E-LK6-19]